MGTLEMGTLEIGTLEIGTLDIRTLEIGTLEIGILEIGTLEIGTLEIGTPQEHMYAQSVGLVEALKLEQSPDGKKFIAPNKGLVRGKDSDDTIRCLIGLYAMIQNAIVQPQQARKNAILGNYMSNLASFDPKII